MAILGMLGSILLPTRQSYIFWALPFDKHLKTGKNFERVTEGKGKKKKKGRKVKKKEGKGKKKEK